MIRGSDLAIRQNIVGVDSADHDDCEGSQADYAQGRKQEEDAGNLDESAPRTKGRLSGAIGGQGGGLRRVKRIEETAPGEDAVIHYGKCTLSWRGGYGGGWLPNACGKMAVGLGSVINQVLVESRAGGDLQLIRDNGDPHLGLSRKSGGDDCKANIRFSTLLQFRHISTHPHNAKVLLQLHVGILVDHVCDLVCPGH